MCALVVILTKTTMTTMCLSPVIAYFSNYRVGVWMFKLLSITILFYQLIFAYFDINIHICADCIFDYHWRDKSVYTQYLFIMIFGDIADISLNSLADIEMRCPFKSWRCWFSLEQAPCSFSSRLIYASTLF